MNRSISNSVLFYMILFFAASCGKGEDGGKGTVVGSSFENRSENDLELIFYISGVSKEVSVQKKEIVELSVFTSPPPGFLKRPLVANPFDHDSLIVITNLSRTIYLAPNCLEDGNPLCIENYEKIETNENGEKVIKLKFVYK